MSNTTVFQDQQDTIWQTRDFIVDQALDARAKGEDFEALIDAKCVLFNIEYYIVREHFNECVRFLSLETVTVK